MCSRLSVWASCWWGKWLLMRGSEAWWRWHPVPRPVPCLAPAACHGSDSCPSANLLKPSCRFWVAFWHELTDETTEWAVFVPQWCAGPASLMEISFRRHYSVCHNYMVSFSLTEWNVKRDIVQHRSLVTQVIFSWHLSMFRGRIWKWQTAVRREWLVSLLEREMYGCARPRPPSPQLDCIRWSARARVLANKPAFGSPVSMLITHVEKVFVFYFIADEIRVVMDKFAMWPHLTGNLWVAVRDDYCRRAFALALIIPSRWDKPEASPPLKLGKQHPAPTQSLQPASHRPTSPSPRTASPQQILSPGKMKSLTQ